MHYFVIFIFSSQFIVVNTFMWSPVTGDVITPGIILNIQIVVSSYSLNYCHKSSFQGTSDNDDATCIFCKEHFSNDQISEI